MSTGVIGQPIDRKDGIRKVTGAAPYAGEQQVARVAYGVVVEATMSKGRIAGIDDTAAKQAPGFIALLSHLNAPRLKHFDAKSTAQKLGEPRMPLQDNMVHYDGQHVALVVAETFEQATEAAALVKVKYIAERPVVTLEQGLPEAIHPKTFINDQDLQVTRGDMNAGLAAAETKLEQTYSTPVQHHNPMEPHATLALWEGDKLSVFETTQGVMNMRAMLAEAFDLKPEQVHVESPFVGGGFGSKGFVWPHSFLAAMAARALRRPVKLTLTRQQMFSSNGHRARTVQRITLGAKRDGRLTAIRHATQTESSDLRDFTEPAGMATTILYAAPNLEVSHLLSTVNKGTPTPMRAPGEAVGPYALESAMDELAYQLNIDPIELRLRNYAEKEPQTGKPWSSKNLRECYEKGAAAFDWSRRNPKPGSMRDGRLLIGLGMATATYPANRRPASARVRLGNDGQVLVQAATQDIGTGTYTILAQIAADALDIPVERVQVEIGDSNLPRAETSGGSSSAASVGPAVHVAAETLRRKILELGGQQDGAASGEALVAALRRANLPMMEAEAQLNPAGTDAMKPDAPPAPTGKNGKPEEPFAWHSFGAQFVEVRVDPLIGQVRVSRMVSVIDAGRPLNAKTARNQIQGGVTWGLGMALMEHTVYDPRDARLVTRNLADYLVPVNPDVPDIDVIFIDKPDLHFNVLGARGIGEIGITGTAAAIANAVYHATGRRIRDLPITPEKLI
jgi:xanthine dehydrogenase YagR molybdenum-binding subunit